MIQHKDQSMPCSAPPFILLLVVLFFTSCTIIRECPGPNQAHAWSKVINTKQERKRYFVQWKNLEREVHYPSITNGVFRASLHPYETIPCAIKAYVHLPKEVKVEGRLDEVRIQMVGTADNPFRHLILIEEEKIKTVTISKYDRGYGSLIVFLKIVNVILDAIINGTIDIDVLTDLE